MTIKTYKLMLLASLFTGAAYGQDGQVEVAPTPEMPAQEAPASEAPSEGVSIEGDTGQNTPSLDAPAMDIQSQDIPPTEGVVGEDPVHQDLRAMKDAVLDAFNKRDMARLATFLDPNVVITWANGEVSRGPEGLTSYFKKMMEGPDKIVDEIKINPEVSELTIIHGGDTGIAWGTSADYYKLSNGMELNVTGYWSMTVVRAVDGWKIAAFQSSMNAFDNAIIDQIKKTYVWVAVGMLIAGLAFGAFFMRLFSRR